MPDGSRIPRTIEGFDIYIRITSAYFEKGSPATHAVRLGITEGEVEQWNDYCTQWCALHALYINKQISRTTVVINKMRAIIQQAVTFNQTYSILERIAASPNMTIGDLETFRIKRGPLQKSTHTVPQTSVKELVDVVLKPLGGGMFAMKCYSGLHKRPCINPAADSVQYLYMTGDTPPASAGEATLITGLSTKACFRLALPGGSRGKTLYIYFRWYNTKRPNLSGPWSKLKDELIL
ncbi:hypothetical protein [Microbacter margulisiae]|uniref:DNA-binding transcriptional regulator YdaS (Cro superfamily) n=1 Tax=Microbacter margulisiae TaxID=1350067 RepID=A0A7W5DRQ3_9PORP|nr:hypothetical protein [Microbacter margulisiae]MBB3187857.1 DNA-binding transcriptional regulator YdaS (Cro superfamily) [Microbacter margulisiae]